MNALRILLQQMTVRSYVVKSTIFVKQRLMALGTIAIVRGLNSERRCNGEHVAN